MRIGDHLLLLLTKSKVKFTLIILTLDLELLLIVLADTTNRIHSFMLDLFEEDWLLLLLLLLLLQLLLLLNSQFDLLYIDLIFIDTVAITEKFLTAVELLLAWYTIRLEYLKVSIHNVTVAIDIYRRIVANDFLSFLRSLMVFVVR
jgi:hypothetical protein